MEIKLNFSHSILKDMRNDQIIEYKIHLYNVSSSRTLTRKKKKVYIKQSRQMVCRPSTSSIHLSVYTPETI